MGGTASMLYENNFHYAKTNNLIAFVKFLNAYRIAQLKEATQLKLFLTGLNFSSVG